jgi:hypothetical protein
MRPTPGVTAPGLSDSLTLRLFPDPLVPIGLCNLRPRPKRTGASVTLIVTNKEADLPKRKAKLSDPNFVEFPFTFDIGDEAFHKQDKVTIQDGTFEEDEAGAYLVTYVTRTADGRIRRISQQELSKTTRRG